MSGPPCGKSRLGMDLLRFILRRFFDVNALNFMNIGAERAFTQAQLELNFMVLHLLVFGWR